MFFSFFSKIVNEKKVEEINYQSYPLTDNWKKIYRKKRKDKNEKQI